VVRLLFFFARPPRSAPPNQRLEALARFCWVGNSPLCSFYKFALPNNQRLPLQACTHTRRLPLPSASPPFSLRPSFTVCAAKGMWLDGGALSDQFTAFLHYDPPPTSPNPPPARERKEERDRQMIPPLLPVLPPFTSPPLPSWLPLHTQKKPAPQTRAMVWMTRRGGPLNPLSFEKPFRLMPPPPASFFTHGRPCI
jgi:hypothetical protein